MSNASTEIVNVYVPRRGNYAVAVYPVERGYEANYGALDVSGVTREDAIANIRLSLSICQPACGGANSGVSLLTLRLAARRLSYVCA